MKKKKTVKSAMDAALDFLSAKPRTVRETEDKLDSLNYGEYEVYQAVERLKELGYLNDLKFAEDFISSRLATKPVSRRKLKEQLYTHKLPADCIDEAISAVTDEVEQNNAALVAEKFYRQFEGLEERDRKQRVMRRLLSRGYDFNTVRQSVENIIGSVEDIDCTFEEDLDEE